MANQAISLTPTRSIDLFGDLPPITEQTYLPRGQVIFNQNASDIAAKVLGNTQSILITCELPANFAYSLHDFSLKIDCNTAAHTSQIDTVGALKIDPSPNLKSKPIGLELFSNGTTGTNSNTGDQGAWVLEQHFSGLIYNQIGDTPEAQVFVNDRDTANAADARRLFMTMKFYVYDIRQVTDVAVNAPMPVRLS